MVVPAQGLTLSFPAFTQARRGRSPSIGEASNAVASSYQCRRKLIQADILDEPAEIKAEMVRRTNSDRAS